jgi:hypothetical protein
MKRILASVAVAALSASFAFAAVEDPMASRYGNTVVAKGTDGKEVGRTYYNADNTYSRKTPDGKESKGTWKIEGGKLCLTQTDPTPAKPEAATQCFPAPGAQKVGDSWDVQMPDGTKLTATLQKGRP